MIKCAIYGGASTVSGKVNEKRKSGDMTWEKVNITKNPEHYEQTFEVRHNGEHVITMSRLYGFGFGSNAWYPSLSQYQIDKLRELGVYVDVTYEASERARKAYLGIE